MILTYNVDIQKQLHYIIFKEMNEIRSWGLSRNDLKVMASFYNKGFELLTSIPSYNERMLVLFSKETKNGLIKDSAISYNTFNNSLSKLRKKGLIKGNFLHENLLFNLNRDTFDLTIRLVNEPEVTKITTGTS